MKNCNICGLNPRHSTLSMCKECRKIYNTKNKICIKNYNKNRYEDKKEIILDKMKIYSLKNKESIKEYTKIWFQENKEHINKYNRDKYKNDPIFKLKLLLRNSLKNKLKAEGNRKYKSSFNLLGCTIQEFKLHLQQQFKPEMTWENHGTIWEIDHIKPCASFDLSILEEQQQCFHYTNLQPLFKTTEIARSFGYLNEMGNRDKNKY